MENIEYQPSLEILEIAKKLQERYFPFIGYVDLDEILFAEIIGFKPEKAPIYTMSGVTQKWARDLILSNNQKKTYCLSVWRLLSKLTVQRVPSYSIMSLALALKGYPFGLQAGVTVGAAGLPMLSTSRYLVFALT